MARPFCLPAQLATRKRGCGRHSRRIFAPVRTLPPIPRRNDLRLWRRFVIDAFSEDPRRLAHTLAVHERASRVTAALDIQMKEFALAALLHDIGRAIDPDDMEPHALVGARFCEEAGLPTPVTILVANHTGARFESDLRGYLHEHARFFPPPVASDRYRPSPALLALSYIDATTSADGRLISVPDRLLDIELRHGENSPQHRAFLLALPEIDQGFRLLQEPPIPPSWDA